MSEYPPAEESLARLHRSGWSIGERTGAVEFWHMTDSHRELGRRELHQRPEHGPPLDRRRQAGVISRSEPPESPCVHGRGGKSKAVHALARRVGKALYYCHLKNEPFDDSGYQALLSESSYPLCPVEEMGLSPGVVRKLKANGLRTSRQVVDAFYSDLGRRPGCGKVTVQAVATWIDSHRDRSRDRTRKPKGPEASGDPPPAEG